MAPPLPKQYHLCPTCGHRIVRAMLRDGREVLIDDGARAYMLILNADNMTYRAEASGARPVHLCREEKDHA